MASGAGPGAHALTVPKDLQGFIETRVKPCYSICFIAHLALVHNKEASSFQQTLKFLATKEWIWN